MLGFLQRGCAAVGTWVASVLPLAPYSALASFLGAESSPAFVRAPEGNGCAERFIRTLKENLLWVHTFDTVEDLRRALLDFKETYNTIWLIERLGYRTPKAIRQNQLPPMALAA